jgi:hypothetical protein
MPVQLTDRDYEIFKVIEEHGVLLEKHISYFLPANGKPSFVRDRLRRLSYCEYVVTGTHDSMLSWWTSPTKPLMYALSPATRELIGAKDHDRDLGHFQYQRHLLEVANIRMLFHRDERQGRISGVQWTTKSRTPQQAAGLDAKVSFLYQGKIQKIGIINQASREIEDLARRLESTIAEEDVDLVCVIAADQSRLQAIQSHLAGATGNASVFKDRVVLTTHKQLYKSGIVDGTWQDIEKNNVSILVKPASCCENVEWIYCLCRNAG